MVFLGDQKGGGKDQSPPKELRGEGDFKRFNCQKRGGGRIIIILWSLLRGVG